MYRFILSQDYILLFILMVAMLPIVLYCLGGKKACEGRDCALFVEAKFPDIGYEPSGCRYLNVSWEPYPKFGHLWARNSVERHMS